MKNLLDQFINFEKNEELFDLSIRDVMIWDYIRSKVYGSISKQSLKVKYTKLSLKESPMKSLLGVVNQLFFIVLNLRLFLRKSKKDILVLGHPRRQLSGVFYEDIYTDAIVKNLREKYSILSLEVPMRQSHLRPINMEEVYYLDLLEIGKTFAPYLSRIRLSKNEIERIENIQKRIFEVFHVQINLLELIKEHLIKYRYVQKRVAARLERLSPRVVITVDGYNFTKKIFTEIANKRNIPTIELQHGTIGALHLAYNYPSEIYLESFPVNFFSWGEYWHIDARFPSDTNIYNLGFPYMDNQKKKMNNLIQKENNILVSSQWTIGLELMNYINNCAESIRDHNFIVKLHPLEFDSIESYKKLALHSNISFVTNEMNIYDLFSMCKTHIGVYSTTLMEGLAFNLRTLIVPLNGYEMYKGMIDLGYMFALNSSAELNILLKKEIEENSTEKLWVSNSLINVTSYIEKLMK